MSSDGELQGVGLLIASDPSNGHLVVLASISGGPADRAGVQAGDEVCFWAESLRFHVELPGMPAVHGLLADPTPPSELEVLGSSGDVSSSQGGC